MSAKVLVTGAFGNVGANALRHLSQQGHTITAFDVKTPANEKTAQALAAEARFNIVWGDLRQADSVRDAVMQAAPDAILHIAAVIAPTAYVVPQVAYDVNVTGTQNLIEAAQALAQDAPTPPKFVFVSSYSVHGPRNPYRNLPPLTGDTPVNPQDNYGRHKVIGEQAVQASGLPWTILRLPAVLATSSGWGQAPEFMKFGFLLPMDRREHVLDSRDAGLALANSVSTDVDGRIFDLGGPEEDCRVVGRDFMAASLRARGLRPFPESANRLADPDRDDSWYYEDWIDTHETQAVLKYQQHSFADYLALVKQQAGVTRFVLPVFAPLIMRQLLKASSTYGNPPTYDGLTVWEAVKQAFNLPDDLP